MTPKNRRIYAKAGDNITVKWDLNQTEQDVFLGSWWLLDSKDNADLVVMYENTREKSTIWIYGTVVDTYKFGEIILNEITSDIERIKVTVYFNESGTMFYDTLKLIYVGE